MMTLSLTIHLWHLAVLVGAYLAVTTGCLIYCVATLGGFRRGLTLRRLVWAWFRCLLWPTFVLTAWDRIHGR